MPPTKSPDDLKAILRAMTAKNGAEKEQKQAQNQQSLKGTLADVLGRNKQEGTAGNKPDIPDIQKPTEKQPFEVPEDALRKVLKGES